MKKTNWELLTGVYKDGYELHLKNENGTEYYSMKDGFSEGAEEDSIAFLNMDGFFLEHLCEKEVNELTILKVEKITQTFSVGDHVIMFDGETGIVQGFRDGFVLVKTCFVPHVLQFRKCDLEHNHDYYLQKDLQVKDYVEAIEPIRTIFETGTELQDAILNIANKLNKVIEHINNK